MGSLAAVSGADKVKLAFRVNNDEVLVPLSLGVGADPFAWSWKITSKVSEDEGNLVRDALNPFSRCADRYASRTCCENVSFDFGEAKNSTASDAPLDMIVPVSVVMVSAEGEPFNGIEVGSWIGVFAKKLEKGDGKCFNFHGVEPATATEFTVFKFPVDYTELVLVTSQNRENHEWSEARDS